MWIQIKGTEEQLTELITQLKATGLEEMSHKIEKARADLADPRLQAYRDAAAVREGDMECDQDAAVSLGEDPGAYVMTWKWVSDDALAEENTTT